MTLDKNGCVCQLDSIVKWIKINMYKKHWNGRHFFVILDYLNYATSFMSVPLETEVQERIFYDRRITTVVDKDRDANHEALFRLKEHMDRENEMLRSAGNLHI